MKTRSARSLIAAARRTYSDMNKLAEQHVDDKTLGPVFARMRDTARAARTLIQGNTELPSDIELVSDEKVEIAAEIYGYHLTGNYSIDELVDFYNLPPDCVRRLANRQQPNFNSRKIPMAQ